LPGYRYTGSDPEGFAHYQILDEADQSYAQFLSAARQFAITHALDIGEEPPPQPTHLPAALSEHDSLDLARENINVIVWATGYTYDFGWVRVPAFDQRGRPVQRRVVAEAAPGGEGPGKVSWSGDGEPAAFGCLTEAEPPAVDFGQRDRVRRHDEVFVKTGVFDANFRLRALEQHPVALVGIVADVEAHHDPVGRQPASVDEFGPGPQDDRGVVVGWRQVEPARTPVPICSTTSASSCPAGVR
jgi:hypothetical protein